MRCGPATGGARHATAEPAAELARSGWALFTAGHRHGWVVAEGGSRSITDAHGRGTHRPHGGKIETGVRVGTAAEQLPPADVTLLDLAPARPLWGSWVTACRTGSQGPDRRFRHGPSVFKVDFAVQGGVPWTHAGRAQGRHPAPVRRLRRGRRQRAGHLGRSHAHSAPSSWSASSIWPTRSAAPVTSTRSTPTHTCPHGYTGDATEAIIGAVRAVRPRVQRTDRPDVGALRPEQIEPPTTPGYVGGDIVTGAKDIRQLVFGPRTTLWTRTQLGRPRARTSARRPPHPAPAPTAMRPTRQPARCATFAASATPPQEEGSVASARTFGPVKRPTGRTGLRGHGGESGAGAGRSPSSWPRTAPGSPTPAARPSR